MRFARWFLLFGIRLGNTRSTRRRRRPSLQYFRPQLKPLENRCLPSGLYFAFVRNFNMNGSAGASPAQVGPVPYLQVVSTPYSPALHYGWLNVPAGNWDRGAATLGTPASGAPDFRSLLEAFNDGSDNTFRVDLPAGTTYTVTATMGDTRATHGPVDVFTVVNGVATRVTSITLGDGSVVNSLYSPIGQFLTGSFQVTAPSGSGLQPVELEFKPESGAVDFVLNALDLVQNPDVIALSATGQSTVNNQEVVTLSGSGATPNSLVTVSSNAGTTSADASGRTLTDDDPNYAGVQVRTDSSGHFTFTVQAAAVGPVTFSGRDVTGAAFGQATITVQASTVVPLPALHFQFSANFNMDGAQAPARRKWGRCPISRWCPLPIAPRCTTAGSTSRPVTMTAALLPWALLPAALPTSCRSWRPSMTAATTPSGWTCPPVRRIPLP